MQESYSDAEVKAMQLQKKINDLNNQHSQEQKSFSQSQSALQTEHQSRIDNLKSENSLELQKHQQKLNKRISKLQDEHSELVQQLNSKHSTETQQLQHQLVSILNCHFSCRNIMNTSISGRRSRIHLICIVGKF